jgi:K+-sensing histidine kinase KdpD
MRTSITNIVGCSEQNDLTSQLTQLAEQLEILDSLCEGVFMSLSYELGSPDTLRPNDFSEISISNEVERIWNFVRIAARRPDMQLKKAPRSSPTKTIRMSQRFLTNVLYSLLHNAAKYADERSELLVSWGDPRGRAHIKVRSVGEPISPEKCEAIFHRFVQGRKADRTGVGLGLWVARKLMNISGGDLKLELDADNPRASTFVIDVPMEI